MKLSIVTPVYNLEDYIEKNVQEVIKQIVNDVEFIIVNDGSTDNSEKKLEQYINNTSVLMISKKNGGVSSARNAGIAKASGDFVLFLDGDDFLEPHAIMDILEVLSRVESDVFIFNYQNVNSNYELSSCKNKKVITQEMQISDKEVLFDYLFLNKKISIWTGCLVVSSKLCKENNVLFNEKYSYAEDLNFFYKILFYSDKIFCSPKIISNYYERASSLTNQYNIKKLLAFEAIRDISKSLSLNVNNNISRFFKYDLAITTYMLNYVDCMQNFKTTNKFKVNQKLKDEISIELNALQKSISEVRIDQFFLRKNKVKWMIFKISPWLYLKLIAFFKIN